MKKTFKDVLVNPDDTIKKVMSVIQKSSKQIALVVDDNMKLLGTITDGDIRRALLNGIELNSSAESIMFRKFITASIYDTKESILKKAVEKKVHQVPILNDEGQIVNLKEIEELIKPEIKNNKVVLMVGGLGSRLYPLTKDTPKPMLKVGNKPILLTIVEKFAEYGYTNIIMCVNYKSHIIQDYFGDGNEFGVNIEYILEEQRMGTAGALSLLKEKPTESFFVMNGDLLTNVNFEHLHDFHIANDSMGTMCVREYDFQVPYGVVNIDGSKIKFIEEKPIHKFFVSAGIYMFSPDVLEYIPKNEFYDMPTLFEKLISENKNAISFPLREYWLDIGRMEEYKKANDEYDEVF